MPQVMPMILSDQSPSRQVYVHGEQNIRLSKRTSAALQSLTRKNRLTLNTVESVLLRHPNVRQALVVAREDNPGGPLLAAYVLPDRGQEPTPGVLRSFLLEQLPEYTMLSVIVMLDRLPFPGGKLSITDLKTGRCKGTQASYAGGERPTDDLWERNARAEK
jgi:non-ribosomal peptide synthetase component E (peptide arylation enzyme)